MHSLFPSLSLPPQEVEAIKEGYLDRAGRFQVYTLGNCPLYPQDCCNLTHTPVICTCTQPCVYIDTCLLLSVFIYCLRLFNLALEPTTTPLYCPTWLLSLQRLQQPLSTAQPGSWAYNNPSLLPNLALEPTTTPLYCPTWLLSLQQPLSTARMFAHNTTLKSRCQYDRRSVRPGVFISGVCCIQDLLSGKEQVSLLEMYLHVLISGVLLERAICNEYFGKWAGVTYGGAAYITGLGYFNPHDITAVPTDVDNCAIEMTRCR
jgi:hypothetical protein